MLKYIQYGLRMSCGDLENKNDPIPQAIERLSASDVVKSLAANLTVEERYSRAAKYIGGIMRNDRGVNSSYLRELRLVERNGLSNMSEHDFQVLLKFIRANCSQKSQIRIDNILEEYLISIDHLPEDQCSTTTC